MAREMLEDPCYRCCIRLIITAAGEGRCTHVQAHHPPPLLCPRDTPSPPGTCPVVTGKCGAVSECLDAPSAPSHVLREKEALCKIPREIATETHTLRMPVDSPAAAAAVAVVAARSVPCVCASAPLPPACGTGPSRPKLQPPHPPFPPPLLPPPHSTHKNTCALS